MRFVPAQLSEILGVPWQTLRYWLEALYPEVNAQGRGPRQRFRPADVLALFVVRNFNRRSVRPSRLTACIEELVGLCTRDWQTLKNRLVAFHLQRSTIHLIQSYADLPEPDQPEVVAVPLGELINEFYSKVFENESSNLCATEERTSDPPFMRIKGEVFTEAEAHKLLSVARPQNAEAILARQRRRLKAREKVTPIRGEKAALPRES